jgi:hypothetical protein
VPKQRQTGHQLPEVGSVAQDEAAGSSSHQSREDVVTIDPLRHPAWDSLLETHPRASVFHTAGWAQVLHETYAHRPLYLCRVEGGRLRALFAVMEVSSRWTGRRGVSLPFTDFCPLLKTEDGDGRSLLEFAMETGRARRWKYLECRSRQDEWENGSRSLAFYGHEIDLTVGSDALFKRLDDPVRRGVKKAEKSALQVEFSTDCQSIQTYYSLHCQTRRRHGVPPQPFRFFQNIQRYILKPGHGFVVTVRLKERPLASAVFLTHGRQAFYKFGASDYTFQQMRPNNLLMWEAMRACARQGYSSLHLGRTSLGQEGLRRFKRSLGASEEIIEYMKYDFSSNSFVTSLDRAEGGWFNRVFASLPAPLLRLAGQMLYPHLS